MKDAPKDDGQGKTVHVSHEAWKAARIYAMSNGQKLYQVIEDAIHRHVHAMPPPSDASNIVKKGGGTK